MNEFEKMQAEAIEHLGKICGHEVMGTPEGMMRVQMQAKRCGSFEECVKVKYWTGQWYWAEYENKYHKKMVSAEAK